MGLLLFLPWVSAITWTILTKNMLLSGLLLFGFGCQLFLTRKQAYPFSWMISGFIMQLGWLLAAMLSDVPLITIGMFLQLMTMSVMYKALHAEQDKFKAMIENYEQQTALLYELRQQRHDFHKHVDAITFAPHAERYKELLQERYSDVDNVLRSESNIAAGALFSYKEQAKEKGIAISYQIHQPISLLPFREEELVSFIGNMMTNAIEAAEEYQNKTRKKANIVFSCRKQSGIWIITCQNSTMPLESTVIEKAFTKGAITSKGGHHEGLGTQQIMSIVKKNDGLLDFIAAENTFTLKIKIPDVMRMKEQRR